MSWLIRSPYPESTPFPSVVGGTAVYYTFPSTSQSIAIPAGYQTGDLLCLYVIVRGYSSTVSANHTISTSGWSTVSSQHNATVNAGIYTYYKVGGAGESNPTVAFTSAQFARVIMVCYRNATVLQNPQASLTLDSSSPFTINSRTTASPGLLALIGTGFRLNNSTAPGAPSFSPTTLAGATFDTSLAGAGFVAHVEATTAATYGAWTVTFATSSSNLVSNVLEIR